MKRTELKRKTPMRRSRMARGKGPQPKPKAPKSRAKGSPNNFPEESRMAMRKRSGGACEVGSAVCTIEASAFHHRQSRRHKDQRPCNGLHVCRACHDYLHAHPTMSYLMGWLVRAEGDPGEIPVKRGDTKVPRLS